MSWRLEVGEGLELRAWKPEDAEEVFALARANFDRLTAWMPWATAESTADDTRAFIESAIKREGEREGNGLYLEGELIGSAGLSVDALNRVGEIGYWIDAVHEGRGIITRCCVALIDHGFGQMGLHRIQIHAAPDNSRSRAVPERLGFTREGQIREAGRVASGYVDLVVYGLLAHEWAARRP